MGAKLTAIEYEYPRHKLSNDDLKLEFPNYDFTQFEAKVGIHSRYIVAEGETALDLAVRACQKLFAHVDKNQIDYILYCTQSPEYFLPTTACILQDKLGITKNIGAFDFNLGCSGYSYGLSLSKAIINCKQARNVLLVTAETYSRFLNPKDRSNRAIFGDAATASLISWSEDEQIGEFLFGTDGSGFDKLIIRNGGARNVKINNPQEIVYGTDNIYTDNDLYMNGPDIFNFTSSVIPNFTEDLLEKNKISKDEVDQFVFHQANSFMLDFIRKRIKVSKDKFYIDLSDGGNTVSNTIPIALKKYSEGILEEREVLIVGFGVGLSWSGGLIKLSNKL
jgi:3-oxoacyl-[acyl-carrier-protein] synthase-3